jgi:hypothetical protein
MKKPIKLLTIKHGSMLYGTNTPTSDIDLKTIYLPDYGDMLIGKKAEIYKERDAKPNESTKAGEIEEEFIPIQVFAKHFLQNQTYALEVVFAYISNTNVEYINQEYEMKLKHFFNGLVSEFANKNIECIIGYAYSQALKYSLKGERLDAIRKLYNDISELALTQNLNKLTIQDFVLANITKYSRNNNEPIFITTIPATRANDEQDALAIGNKTFAFNTTLKHFSKSLKILENKYGDRTEQSLSGTDWKAMMHSVRIIQQGIEYLMTKQITFPRNNTQFLLQIKNGELSEEFVAEFIRELFSQLQYQQQQTTLQEMSPELEEYFFNWLKLQMIGVYITYDVA